MTADWRVPAAWYGQLAGSTACSERRLRFAVVERPKGRFWPQNRRESGECRFNGHGKQSCLKSQLGLRRTARRQRLFRRRRVAMVLELSQFRFR